MILKLKRNAPAVVRPTIIIVESPPIKALDQIPCSIALNQLHDMLESLPDNGSFLEWGCGGSTLWMLERIKPGQRMTSVEHDAEWSNKIARRAVDVNHAAYTNIHQPVTIAGVHGTIWEESPSACDAYINSPPYLDSFDTILIDGIARGPCLARLLIQGFEGVVYVHDVGQRNWYDWCLRYVDNVEVIHAEVGGHTAPIAKLILKKRC